MCNLQLFLNLMPVSIFLKNMFSKSLAHAVWFLFCSPPPPRHTSSSIYLCGVFLIFLICWGSLLSSQGNESLLSVTIPTTFYSEALAFHPPSHLTSKRVNCKLYSFCFLFPWQLFESDVRWEASSNSHLEDDGVAPWEKSTEN